MITVKEAKSLIKKAHQNQQRKACAPAFAFIDTKIRRSALNGKNYITFIAKWGEFNNFILNAYKEEGYKIDIVNKLENEHLICILSW